MSLNQRLIAGLLLLVALVATVALLAVSALREAAAHNQLAHIAMLAAWIAIPTAICIAVGFALAVLRPLKRAAEQVRGVAQGNLEQRLDWSANDSLGQIANDVNRMVVHVRDLRETEFGRKQMEHQLSDAVVQSIFEPVIVTDARGQVLKLNTAAEQLLGESAGDRMALENTPGGQKILTAVRDAVSMQRPVAHEGEAALLPMWIGQAERSYRLRTNPIRDNDGKLLGAVSVLEDVTELQDLDRFKTRFIAVASDKLRTPLEQLRLALYSLTQGFAGDLRPLQSDLIHGAQEEAERLNDLMADLIDVAELDTGRRELRMERLRPIDILRDAALRFQEDARKRDVQIQIEAFSDLSPIHGDRRALKSVMDNLLSNALRFTPAKGTIVLQAEEQKKRVQFFVRDTGIGIEPERLKRIFGRFVQGPRSAESAEEVRGAVGTAGPDGTGLGLALVRRLIELMHGQVSVESRVGHGTTFSFTLPLAPTRVSRHAIEVG
ncbi:MAG TPA: ATP-binding protein [Acidobacteriaceae bacterium]|jgi:signal transduction histidine kinase|nr:ATP-binding protein [Acidobacteriaceae bacterium]